LNRFLAAHSLFQQPELTFSDKYVLIESDNKTIKYVYTDVDTLLYPHNTSCEIASDCVTFDLTKDQFLTVLKSSSVIDLPQVSFVGKDGKISLSSCAKENPASNNFTLNLNCETQKEFECVVLLDRFESILPGDYSISVSNGLVHWSNKNINLQYWLTSELEYSTF